jgi:hypothetical protein
MFLLLVSLLLSSSKPGFEERAGFVGESEVLVEREARGLVGEVKGD